jgi:YHS domain-containing protein
MIVLLRILAFIGVLWLVRRFLAVIMGRSPTASRPAARETVPGNTVKDPICGMYLDPQLAIRVPGKDGDVFFCSEECRRRYT